jgi:cytidine deaminase
MVAGGDRKIAAIAIVADPSVTPCGGCRQKLAEFSKPETLVLMSGKSGASMRQERMESLLPHAFKSVSGR